MRISRIGYPFVVAVCGFAASGCASIVSGKNQPVSVAGTCEGSAVVGASCKLTNSKGEWFVNTPGSVTINKAYGDLVVQCTREGLSPAGGTFKSSSNGGVWGNIIAGGIIGYAVDAGTGAGFDYPTAMTVRFEPPCENAEQTASAAGSITTQ